MASFNSTKVDPQIVRAGFSILVTSWFGAVLFEAFLFGLYTILFIISVYVLVWCNKTKQWFLLVTSIVMYAIATADIIYTVWLLFSTVMGKMVFEFRHLYPKYSLFVTNTFVAHGLLLYRCVVVWGHNWWLTGLGILGLLSVTAVGYILEGTSLELVSTGWVYLSLTLLLNLALTGLTAGKILYITKQNYRLLPRSLKRRYIITIAILVECGAVYTIYLALNLAFQKHPTANAVLDCAAVQLVGMVPTLIIVQVGLGRSASHDQAKEEPVEFVTSKRATIESGVLVVQARSSTASSNYSVYSLTQSQVDSC